MENSLSIFYLFGDSTSCFALSLWIHHLFREVNLNSPFSYRFTMNSPPISENTVHNYHFCDFTLNKSKITYFRIKYRLRKFTLDSISIREYPINSLSIFSAYSPRIHYLFRESTMIFFVNSLWINFFSRIHYDLVLSRKWTMNSLPISRISYQFTAFLSLLSRFTMNSLSLPRNNYEFASYFKISLWLHAVFGVFTIFLRIK